MARKAAAVMRSASSIETCTTPTSADVVVEVVEAHRHGETNVALVKTGLDTEGIARDKVAAALRIPARVKKRSRCATNDDMELPLRRMVLDSRLDLLYHRQL
jgi:hypothetical protein